jgi:hypothetical protein
MEHHGNHIQGDCLNLMQVRGKRVSEHMCCEVNLFALDGLEHQTMTEKTQTGIYCTLCEMFMVVLKQIRSRCRKAMCSLILEVETDSWKALSWL